MTDEQQKLLESIDWSRYEAAESSGAEVPNYLKRLLSTNREEAIRAALELDSMLRDHGGLLFSAALPAWPFLLQALEWPDANVVCEVLGTICVLASCTADYLDSTTWQGQLREKMKAASDKIYELFDRPDEAVARAAKLVCEYLDIRPATGFPRRLRDFCQQCGCEATVFVNEDILCEPCGQKLRPEYLWSADQRESALNKKRKA